MNIIKLEANWGIKIGVLVGCTSFFIAFVLSLIGAIVSRGDSLHQFAQELLISLGLWQAIFLIPMMIPAIILSLYPSIRNVRGKKNYVLQWILQPFFSVLTTIVTNIVFFLIVLIISSVVLAL